MGLETYKRKRDFAKTPEPPGKVRRHAGDGFVVQKHAATRLHYDFRLELDGVLKSWAVPKGPSLDPSERRLAVEVEDHPLEYADFEGVIPRGEYGGGAVLVWDRGTWEPVGDPRAGYAKGHLEFVLHGGKLRGGFMLVRLKDREGDRRNWLLIKRHDEAATRLDLTRDRPESVITRRSIEGVAASADRVWHSDRAEAPDAPPRRGAARARRRAPTVDAASVAGARRAPQPDFVEPELATLVRHLPDDATLRHEVKLDGYRVLARVDEHGRVALRTRKGNDWTERFPTVAGMLARLPAPALLDGELVALDDAGVSRFQLLQNALSSGREGRLVYYAFDLLWVAGFDLTGGPLAERQRLLAELLGALPADERVVRPSAHLEGRWQDVYAQACRLGLEGIIAKDPASPYRGRRTHDWLKLKCKARQELAVVGFTDPRGTRAAVGALLVGYYDGGELRYAGKVGTGFDEATLRDLKARLAPHELETPLVRPAPPATRGVHWVEPTLVAEVEFTEWTTDGLLRQPTFLGLRQDRSPREVRRERPAEDEGDMTANAPPRRGRRAAARPNAGGRGAGATPGAPAPILTHPDRVVFSERNVTKAELRDYYEAVAERMLPLVSRRPLMLVRCPDGADGGCFHQKHASRGMPAAIGRVAITERSGREPSLYVEDVAGLVGLVQMNALEVHTWRARVDALERPDELVLDLDPDPSLPWSEVVRSAREVRELLRGLGLTSFVKTTGGKGLHVVAPLAPEAGWPALRSFARGLVDVLVREAPRRYLATAGLRDRQGRIFVDWLRNGRGATAVAPYSPRARADAPVATPLAWDELEPGRRPSFDVRSVLRRLARLRRDPWEGLGRVRQSLGGAARGAEA